MLINVLVTNCDKCTICKLGRKCCYDIKGNSLDTRIKKDTVIYCLTVNWFCYILILLYIDTAIYWYYYIFQFKCPSFIHKFLIVLQHWYQNLLMIVGSERWHTLSRQYSTNDCKKSALEFIQKWFSDSETFWQVLLPGCEIFRYVLETIFREVRPIIWQKSV